MVGFAKTNHFQPLIQERQRSDRQLDLRKSIPFQPSYLKAHGYNDGCFCGNQPRSNLRNLMHMVGMTVGFTKTNRFRTLKQERYRLDWWLVLRKPTIFQPSFRSVNGRIESWIYENQPRSNLRILKPMVGMTVGFARTNAVPTFIS